MLIYYLILKFVQLDNYNQINRSNSMPCILLHHLPALISNFLRFKEFNQQSSKILRIKNPSNNLKLPIATISEIFMEYILLLFLTKQQTNSLFLSKNCFSSSQGIFFYYYLGKTVKPGFRLVIISEWHDQIKQFGKWLLTINVHDQQQLYKQKQKNQWITWLTNLINKPEQCTKIVNKQIKASCSSIIGVEVKDGLSRIIERIEFLGIYNFNNLNIRVYNSMIARKIFENCVNFGYYQKNWLQYSNKLLKRLIVRDLRTLFNNKLEQLSLLLGELFDKRIIGMVYNSKKQINIQQQYGRQETLTVHTLSFLAYLHRESMHQTIPEDMNSYDVIRFSRGCMRAQFQGQFYQSKGKISLKTKTYWKIDMRDFVAVQRIWLDVQYEWSIYITECYNIGFSIDPYRIQLKWDTTNNVYLYQQLQVIKDQFALDLFIQALNRHMLFWLIFQKYMENAFRKTSKLKIFEDSSTFNKKKIIYKFKKYITLLYQFIGKFRE